MAQLTPRELENLEGQLLREQNLVQKYKHYSESCSDPQLKIKCQQMAARHQNHYNALLGQLGAGGTQ